MLKFSQNGSYVYWLLFCSSNILQTFIVTKGNESTGGSILYFILSYFILFYFRCGEGGVSVNYLEWVDLGEVCWLHDQNQHQRKNLQDLHIKVARFLSVQKFELEINFW